MGNEGSKLKGLEIDKNSVEANDFWTLYNAIASTSSNEECMQYLSVFQGEPVVSGQLWVVQGPMERAIKNLMIYRHPYILKYVCTWEQGGQKYLATERIRPLQSLLSQQTDIQICLGLRTILCSLIFLVEKAMARHLNLCIQSIYVADSGSWRLAGFEYVWKCKEITKTLLDLSNAYRYQNAIDPQAAKENNSESLEQYAFANLCEEILNKCAKNTNIPYVKEFKEYCSTHLKHKNPQMRPSLSAVLLHPYFNHEFVLIHSFLFELPLKSNAEKQDFFTGLIDRLRYFDENVVGSQFACDLLSRMVLLDPTAQLCVTPYVLRTKTDHSSALFSGPTYSKYLMPNILKMFRLRDAQIRLILLEYFMEFVRLLTKEELEEHILQHLVAGMQDTNDVLVAKTLRCMADLVPILGASTVLGSQRTRLFSDGRPQAAVSDATSHWVEPRSITPVLGENTDCPMVSGSPIPADNMLSKSNSFSSSLSQIAITSETYEHNMPPRLSPDGGEDVKSSLTLDKTVLPDDADDEDDAEDKSLKTIHVKDLMTLTQNLENSNYQEDDDDEDHWSDWDNDDAVTTTDEALAATKARVYTAGLSMPDDLSEKCSLPTINSSSYNTIASQADSLTDSYRTTQSNTNSSSHSSLKPSSLIAVNDDLSCLDIQVQKTNSTNNPQSSEFDFFKDMQPVIAPKSTAVIQPPVISKWLEEPEDAVVVDAKRFAAVDDSITFDDEGWQVDDDDDHE